MKKLWIVTKNELMRYFVSPLAYVYLLCFLILNASFALYFGDFFNRGQANLYALFEFQPWLYLLFIPGISMRLWAEEFKSKTVVQIVTMPVGISTLVGGKFLASWIFCALALVLTFPFWLTVNILGTPDNSVIALGYLASFILAGCMLSISQTMSALTKNQVIALVLAVIANLVFFWSGVEYILSFFRLFLPDNIIDVIASFSFISHFSTLSVGLLELRDVIFFVTIILFFNFTTVLVVNFRTAGTSGWLKSREKGYYITAWMLLLICFFGVNVIANNLGRNIQFDATEEKLFTLSDDTKYVLHNLPEPVTAKLYFSNILEQRNSNLRLMFDNIRLLLKKYKDASAGKFDYKVYNPAFLSTEEDIALADGLQPIPLIDINQNALFGLTFEDTLQNKQVIPFFAQERQANLEQDITSKIYQLYHKKKTIGVLTGLPIFGTTSDDGSAISERWKIVDLWAENFKVINITAPEDFNEKFDALVLVSPFGIPQNLLPKIKEYSHNGGNILLIADPANEASRLYSFMNNRLQPSDIGELADLWHIRFYNEYVVADLSNSITVDATSNYKSNPTFTQDVIQFKIKPQDMNPFHPVTRHLNEIMLASASVFAPEKEAFENKKIEFIPLLKAGDISSVMTSKVVINGLNPREILQYFQPDDNQKILAAEVRGLEPSHQFDLIVIGDSDFIYDQFWATQKSLLESEYIVSNFDNANFVLNALDYLTGNTDLLQLRGKQAKDRSFAGIDYLRRINSLEFSRKEQEIFEKIDEAKRAINEVWNKKNFEERESFTADELAAISKVRNRLNELRQNLSDIRIAAFKNIDRISNLVVLFNLVLIPALITVILLLIYLIKIIRHRSLKISFHGDKKLLKLAITALVVLFGAMISVYFASYSQIDAYYNKPVFPKVLDNLNNIDNISLKTNKRALNFGLNDGVWTLEQKPEMPVYQERIRRLLTTIADARFFARKSNKAENLGKFDLAPIEDKNSAVMEVELKSGNEIVQKFELGDINVDLGRGAKAAYIKFENQFQVWEIKADFVDMELDWHKWTYSNLWDLRYGRLSYAENLKKQESLLYLMKYLLNTKVEEISTDMPKSEPLISSKFNIENGNYAIFSLYKEGNDYYTVFDFDKINQNKHLQLVAKYLNNKSLKISAENAEKIIEQFKQ
ncbi:MAG: Gldg family protein [Alphaproteobacteria bacterium]|nr:Gldg family protein [Alphaproteobacteria bacterium]